MEKTFLKRFLALGIDLFFLEILLFFVTFLYIALFFNPVSPSDSAALGFMPLIDIIYPFLGVLYMITFSFHSDALLFFMYFVAKTLYFFILEASPLKASIGHKALKVKVLRDDLNNLTLFQLFIRAVLKTLSMSLYFLPHLFLLLRADKKVFYDVLLKSRVVDDK